MRKRTSLVVGASSVASDDDDSHSDPEEAIQAVHPPQDIDNDEVLDSGSLFFPVSVKRFVISKKRDNHQQQLFSLLKKFLQDFKQGKVWYIQILTIAITATLTYSFHNNVSSSSSNPPSNNNNKTNVQIAIMTVITFVGASPFCSTHLTTAAIGCFVGGHNIIGSTGELFNTNTVQPSNFLWLLLLSVVVGLIWCFVMNNSKWLILNGYAGRLGTTTFIGMNLVMLTVFGPVGIVDWDRYYYGFTHIIHVGEEDSAKLDVVVSAWKWTEEAELAIGYVLAVLWLGMVGGTTRILHNKYIQQWNRDNNNNKNNNDGNNDRSSSADKSITVSSPAPLNNVLIPCLWALLSILIVNATQYKYATGLYNGFAVGAYVAMASLQKIPSIFKFATISFVAACWGLILTPVFVGFAGKSGFTSMLGHVTHSTFETLIIRIQESRRRQQHEEQQRQRQQQQRRDEEEQKQQLHPSANNNADTTQNQKVVEEPLQHHRSHSKKHRKSKQETLVFATKQQRRQQQRLKHLQQQQKQQTQKPEQPQYMHRSWSAAPDTDGDRVWQHPLIMAEDDHDSHSHEMQQQQQQQRDSNNVPPVLI